MRLEIASNKAIKYACMNFHYAKAIPVNTFGYSVFNDNNEWCGVILYGTGASPNINLQFNLNKGEVIELVRMALNGKQESTSKAMSISLKLFKKNNPLVKLIISFADIDQNHNGIIYQATNWYFIEKCNINIKTGYIINGKKIHQRSMLNIGKYKRNTLENAKSIDKNAVEYYTKGKNKYIYPLDKNLIPLCKSLSKPYPKKAVEVHKLNSSQTSEKVGGANPTQPL